MRQGQVRTDLLQLLVRVYNQPVQVFHHFPDVILCGRMRLDTEDFQQLQVNGFLTLRYSDSFGFDFCLSDKGFSYMEECVHTRRKKATVLPQTQPTLPFVEESCLKA